MGSLLSLEFPNGRVQEIESGEDLKPGQEFEMYGRQWKVVGVALPPRSLRYGGQRVQRRLLCRQSR